MGCQVRRVSNPCLRYVSREIAVGAVAVDERAADANVLTGKQVVAMLTMEAVLRPWQSCRFAMAKR